MSPTTVMLPLRAPRDHPQLHGREVLHLVDDDVAVRADVVAVRLRSIVAVLRRVALGRFRAEEVAGLVEQGHVVFGPAHLADVVATRPVQRHVLRLTEVFRRREPQQGFAAEQVVQQLGRRQ